MLGHEAFRADLEQSASSRILQKKSAVNVGERNCGRVIRTIAHRCAGDRLKVPIANDT